MNNKTKLIIALIFVFIGLSRFIYLRAYINYERKGLTECV